MATNFWTKITAAGVKANLMDAMGKTPNILAKHAMEIPSEHPSETYAWLGRMPQPRLKLDGRSYQSLNEYSQVITNQTYELSVKIDHDSMMDDHQSMIDMRFAEIAEVVAGYHDTLFGALLIAGETSTETFDGVTFHDDTRTIGGSGTIDNSLTAPITAGGSPTVANMQTAFQSCESAMWRFNDDKGAPGFNRAAMSRMAVIIPPEFRRVAIEALESDMLSQSSNPWGKGLAEYDVLLDLTDADNSIYMSALGSTRMPFVFQRRSPLMVEIYNSPKEVLKEDGVIVLVKERLRVAYGEPRRNCRYDFTTA